MNRMGTLAVLALSFAVTQVRADHDGKKHPVRASAITGMAVKNVNNEDLGTVRDLVIDTKTGRVQFVVIGYGGVAGIGSKQFAVCPSAIKMESATTKPNDKAIYVNATKAQLDADPGFKDEDGTMKHCTLFTPHKDTKYAKNEQCKWEDCRRYRELTKLAVKNTAGESIGGLNDLMIDCHTGKVIYAAVSYGGVAGIGDKLFAFPWNKFAIKPLTGNPNDVVLVLDVNKESLRANPGFNQSAWPTELTDR